MSDVMEDRYGTAPDAEEEYMPVFLINGFLESGKTQFIQYTMDQEYFQNDGKTLLIVCEEGDTEYDEVKLAECRTAVVYVESREEMSPDRLTELELLYNPERVLIEWNGMWNQDELRLPADWIVYQQITIIDMSTFDLYVKNMKPLLGAMVRGSELIICNRCDEVEDLAGYRRTLMAMNQRGQIVFEDSEGEIELEITDEDLPYDMKADVVSVTPENYGIWYIDCMNRTDHYVGKIVEFTAMVLKTPGFPKNYFVPGRMAMTCCEADMSFLGFICKYRGARNLETKDWVKVRARIECEYWQDYEGEGPVLYAEEVVKAGPIREIVQF